MFKMKSKVIYKLTVKDIQTVAKVEFNSLLSDEEIEQVAERIAERIDWYDVIYDEILEIRNREKNNNDIAFS